MGPELTSVTMTLYYGPTEEVDIPTSSSLADGSEWRTPPLWGYRDSGPYLHDGRARNLHEVVKAHKGQARESAMHFSRLPRSATIGDRAVPEVAGRAASRVPDRHRRWKDPSTRRRSLLGPPPVPRPPSDHHAARADAVARAEQERIAASRLKLAQTLEKMDKPQGALVFYREILRDEPDTDAARTAAERIKALGGEVAAQKGSLRLVRGPLLAQRGYGDISHDTLIGGCGRGSDAARPGRAHGSPWPAPGHGLVGRLDEGGGIAGDGRELGHADRDAGAGHPRRPEARLGHGAADRPGDPHRVLAPRADQQRDDPIVVESGDDVAVADDGTHGPGQVVDQAVGDVGTEQVADCAEPVDLHAQERDRLPVAAGLAEGEGEHGVEEGGVADHVRATAWDADCRIGVGRGVVILRHLIFARPIRLQSGLLEGAGREDAGHGQPTVRQPAGRRAVPGRGRVQAQDPVPRRPASHREVLEAPLRPRPAVPIGSRARGHVVGVSPPMCPANWPVRRISSRRPLGAIRQASRSRAASIASGLPEISSSAVKRWRASSNGRRARMERDNAARPARATAAPSRRSPATPAHHGDHPSPSPRRPTPVARVLTFGASAAVVVRTAGPSNESARQALSVVVLSGMASLRFRMECSIVRIPMGQPSSRSGLPARWPRVVRAASFVGEPVGSRFGEPSDCNVLPVKISRLNRL